MNMTTPPFLTYFEFASREQSTMQQALDIKGIYIKRLKADWEVTILLQFTSLPGAARSQHICTFNMGTLQIS